MFDKNRLVLSTEIKNNNSFFSKTVSLVSFKLSILLTLTNSSCAQLSSVVRQLFSVIVDSFLFSCQHLQLLHHFELLRNITD